VGFYFFRSLRNFSRFIPASFPVRLGFLCRGLWLLSRFSWLLLVCRLGCGVLVEQVRWLRSRLFRLLEVLRQIRAFCFHCVVRWGMVDIRILLSVGVALVGGFCVCLLLCVVCYALLLLVGFVGGCVWCLRCLYGCSGCGVVMVHLTSCGFFFALVGCWVLSGGGWVLFIFGVVL